MTPKLVFVTDIFSPTTGGVKLFYDIFKKIVSNKFEIIIISGAVEIDKYTIFDSNLKLINLNIYKSNIMPYNQPSNVIRFLSKVYRIINSIVDSDSILHFNNHFPNLIPYLIRLGKKVKSPSMCSIHHLEDITQFKNIITRYAKIIIQDLLEINTFCNIIHVPSKYTRDIIKSKSIRNKNNIVIIPPGIDTKKYFSLRRRQRDGLFIMIGRLEERKHYEHAIAAFKLVSRYRPDAELIIIGDGPLKTKLSMLIKRLSLEKNVRLIGRVSEEHKLNLLSEATALIHLGYPEGFGMVVLEALASSVPVIAYNVPPLTDLVRHGVTGVVVERNNIVDLAKKIIFFDKYQFNNDIMKKIARKYDIDNVSRLFRYIYMKLLKDKNSL